MDVHRKLRNDSLSHSIDQPFGANRQRRERLGDRAGRADRDVDVAGLENTAQVRFI
jgi:hypothetical protein